MATETYTKALYSGVGQIVIYTGTNLDAIAALVASISSTDWSYHLGYLRVFGELIEVGDGVCLTDDEPPVAHARIPAATLEADEWYITAVAYEGNIDEVMVYAGRDACDYRAGKLYVNGAEIADTDFVAKSHRGKLLTKVTAARMGTDYTIVE